MKKTLLTIVSLLVVALSFGQNTNWKIDQSHANVTFEIDHMVITTVTGSFKEFSGVIMADKPDFSDASVKFTIQAASINTDTEKRDDHLRSADFFDVAKYPTIEFVGKSMTKVSGNKYKLKGDLSMHGVTKSVELDVKYNGTIKDPWGNTRAGFKVSGSLNRTDYGLTYNTVMEAGGLVVGENVDIQVNLELIKQ
ncbi:MAG: YceI family protein [Bacteroidetes bacterium]|nr:YceI family protein [Bacteroidota bacterium]